MIATSAETGMKLAEAFMYRHHPQTKLIGEWVQSGRLGDITHIQASFDFTLTNPDNIRLQPELGGGSLWDIGIYPLSLAQYVMGSTPEWVLGSQWIDESGVDVWFAGHLCYESGGVAQISSSFKSPWRTEAKIFGTKGMLTVTRPFIGDDPAERQMTFCPVGGEPEEIDLPVEYLYLGEVNDMHRVILDGGENYLSLSETRQHVQTLLALYQSAERNEIVYL